MNKRAYALLASGVIVALTVSGLTGQPSSQKAADTSSGAKSSPDEAAIKKAGQSFLQAYMKGDAKAMAAYWTENGEYIADDGTTIRGRANIEKAYTDLFAKKKGAVDAQIDVGEIRFPSKDTAIEEGYFKVRTGDQPPVASKYSVLHVREGGRWLMAVVREWPSEGTSLRDLDWLIGAWEAKHDDTVVGTTYEWWGDKAFLRVAITLKQKDRTRQGFQMIGKDASTGQLRSWTFDSEGSFGEATWSRDDRKWILDSAAVLEDGSILAATNILTPLDNNSFTFQSVRRTVDGEEVADIPPVRVTRVKGK